MTPTDKLLYESRLTTRQAINYAFMAGAFLGAGLMALGVVFFL
jgi:hypothetical protein